MKKSGQKRPQIHKKITSAAPKTPKKCTKNRVSAKTKAAIVAYNPDKWPSFRQFCRKIGVARKTAEYQLKVARKTAETRQARVNLITMARAMLAKRTRLVNERRVVDACAIHTYLKERHKVHIQLRTVQRVVKQLNAASGKDKPRRVARRGSEDGELIIRPRKPKRARQSRR